MENKKLIKNNHLKSKKEVLGMTNPGNNGKLIINKQYLVPLGFVITLIILLVGGVSFAKSLESKIELTETKAELLDSKVGSHIIDQSSHIPYTEQIELWYTRREGEKLDATLQSIDAKLDRLIERDLGD